MANPFDQFDAGRAKPSAGVAPMPSDAASAPPATPAPADTGANPFDQFDTGRSGTGILKHPNPMIATPPKKKASDKPFVTMSSFGAPGFHYGVTEDPTAGDIPASVGSGLAQIPLGIGSLPRTVAELGTSATHWLHDKATGTKTPPWELPEAVRKTLPTYGDLDRLNFLGLSGAANRESKTGLGGIAKFATPFMASSLAGPFSPAGNLAKLGAFPAAATAVPHYLMSDDNPYKQAAELAAGVLSGGSAALLSRPGATAVLRRYVKGVTPKGFDDAAAVQAAGNDIGVPISTGEALPGTGLNKLQRYMEGSPKVGPRFAKFYEDRPAQVKAAGDSAVDAIGPAPNDPSQIGPAVQKAADVALENTRKGINEAADPYYQASNNHLVDPALFASLAANKVYQAVFKKLRKTPEFKQAFGQLPPNAVPVVDAVKKVLDGFAQPQIGADSITNWQNSMRSSLRGDVRDAATASSGPYATALKIGELGREHILDPMTKAPIGKLAETENATKQGNVILPTNPEPNSAFEIGQAIREVQKTDPGSALDLASNHIRKALNEATQGNMGGPNQWGGAKFNAVLRGNTEQGKVLATVIRAVGGNQAWDGFQKMLDVFQATGRRLAEGSPTEPNRLFTEAMKAGSPLPELAAKVASPTKWFSFFNDTYGSWRQSKNLHQIADIFLTPDGVRQLQRIAGMKAVNEKMQAIMTLFGQAQVTNQPRASGGSVTAGKQYFDKDGRLRRDTDGKGSASGSGTTDHPWTSAAGVRG